MSRMVKDIPTSPLLEGKAEGGYISRQATIGAVTEALMSWSHMAKWRDDKIIGAVMEMPTVDVPDVVYCKDCQKHNKDVGDFEMLPDGKRSWIWKDQACPLVSWRGKAQGHEFDYQYCVYGVRKDG